MDVKSMVCGYVMTSQGTLAALRKSNMTTCY